MECLPAHEVNKTLDFVKTIRSLAKCLRGAKRLVNYMYDSRCVNKRTFLYTESRHRGEPDEKYILVTLTSQNHFDLVTQQYRLKGFCIKKDVRHSK